MKTSTIKLAPPSDWRMAEPAVETPARPWHWLYKIGGAAAPLGVAIIPAQLIIFMRWSQPDTALGWFTLFQHNKLAGLLAFEFLFVVNALLGITTTLALYTALRRVNESFMAIALALSLVEAVTLIMARPAIEMLSLSNQYAVATTDVQRALLLAAGETVWTTFNGTAFHVSYNLFSLNLLIVSLVMLRSTIFSKGAAYLGLLAALTNWGLYVPMIGIFLSVLSVVPFYALWNILIARRLFQLGAGDLEKGSRSALKVDGAERR
jgi:hypothetical protein